MKQLITRQLGFESSKKKSNGNTPGASSRNRYLGFFGSKNPSRGSASGTSGGNSTSTRKSKHFDPLATTDSEKAYAAVHLKRGSSGSGDDRSFSDDVNPITHPLHDDSNNIHDNSIVVQSDLHQYDEKVTPPKRTQPELGQVNGGAAFKFADVGERERGVKAYEDVGSAAGVGTRAYHAV